VIGIFGARKIGFVAAITVGRNSRIVSTHMATGARHRKVKPSQRKRWFAVIERRWLPTSGRVAEGARCWEARCHVIGVRGAVEVLDVARGAVGGRVGELAPDVAAGARYIDVKAG